jgi:hypothetical protein
MGILGPVSPWFSALSGNNLSDPIPMDISQWLPYPNLSNNSSFGEIPGHISNMTQFWMYSPPAQQIQLSGQIVKLVRLTSQTMQTLLSDPVPDSLKFFPTARVFCGAPMRYFDKKRRKRDQDAQDQLRYFQFSVCILLCGERHCQNNNMLVFATVRYVVSFEGIVHMFWGS